MSEQEKGAKYLDTFMGAVNADHIDVIPVSRERGCLMRDEIIRLREVESFLESWNKSRRIIDGLTVPIQEKLDMEEKLRELVEEIEFFRDQMWADSGESDTWSDGFRSGKGSAAHRILNRLRGILDAK